MADRRDCTGTVLGMRVLGRSDPSCCARWRSSRRRSCSAAARPSLLADRGDVRRRRPVSTTPAVLAGARAGVAGRARGDRHRDGHAGEALAEPAGARRTAAAAAVDPAGRRAGGHARRGPRSPPRRRPPRRPRAAPAKKRPIARLRPITRSHAARAAAPDPGAERQSRRRPPSATAVPVATAPTRQPGRRQRQRERPRPMAAATAQGRTDSPSTCGSALRHSASHARKRQIAGLADPPAAGAGARRRHRARGVDLRRRPPVRRASSGPAMSVTDNGRRAARPDGRRGGAVARRDRAALDGPASSGTSGPSCSSPPKRKAKAERRRAQR